MTVHATPVRGQRHVSRSQRISPDGGPGRGASGTNAARQKISGGLKTCEASLKRYLELARQAEAAGDEVLSENYYQHAEHFYRMSQGEAA